MNTATNMTRRLRRMLLTTICIVAAAVSLQAQEDVTDAVAYIGYIPYDKVLQQMPEYATAQQSYDQLREKYDAEAKRAEDEFQRKFSDFLQGQKDFPRSIMQKRQTELQELMEKSVAFREEAQRLLAQAQEELQQPARDKLNKAIKTVARRLRLAIVVNTDNNTTPYIDEDMGVGLYEAVLQELGLAQQISEEQNPQAE